MPSSHPSPSTCVQALTKVLSYAEREQEAATREVQLLAHLNTAAAERVAAVQRSVDAAAAVSAAHKQRLAELAPQLAEIDALDGEVTALVGVVGQLDVYTRTLEKHVQWL